MTSALDKAVAYNQAELIAGRLTIRHITELVMGWQMNSLDNLVPDGMFGPATRGSVEAALGPPRTTIMRFLELPLPVLPGNRKPYVTSAFRPKDRPNHVGQDWFYAWQRGDLPDFVGDRGGAGKTLDGTPKHVVPYGVHAIAAANGVIQIAGNSKTGYRCWVDHGNGWRTGYFHLLDLTVSVGQSVVSGQPLGLVGDNPADHDGRHLHFELSPVDRYAPTDPALYARTA